MALALRGESVLASSRLAPVPGRLDKTGGKRPKNAREQPPVRNKWGFSACQRDVRPAPERAAAIPLNGRRAHLSGLLHRCWLALAEGERLLGFGSLPLGRIR